MITARMGLSLLGLSCVFSRVGTASIIENTASTGFATVAAFDPVGQSFVADDVLIERIEVAFRKGNPGPNDPLEVSVLQGERLTGLVLARSSLQLPDSLPFPVQLYDLGIHNVPVVPGETYTFAVSAPTDSPRVAIVFSQFDAFPQGQMYYVPTASHSASPGTDVRFRATLVPEPGVSAILIVSAWILLRRRPAGCENPFLTW